MGARGRSPRTPGRRRAPRRQLERPEAVQRLAAIVDASDAVMVARGDLGLEMPLEDVPQVQKQVLASPEAEACR